MKKSSQFLILTVAIDVLLLFLMGAISFPGDPAVVAMIALLVVSPLVTYLVVFRDDYRRPFRGFDGSRR